MIEFFSDEVRDMRETLALALLCLLIAVASLGAVAWAVVDAAREGVLVGEILTLDGLLMISVSLLLSVMFGFCFLWLARDTGLWEKVKRRRVAASAPANPAADDKPPSGS